MKRSKVVFASVVLMTFAASAWDETLPWKYDEAGRSTYYVAPQSHPSAQVAGMDLRLRAWNSLCSVLYSGLYLVFR